MDVELCEPGDPTVGLPLKARLARFNERVGGMPGAVALVVAARDHGELVGGLVGTTAWGWLFIDVLWVDEEHRGEGVGRRIVRRAEAEARRRGCSGAWVDTLDYQAPGFYRALGYEEFGRLSGFGPHTRYWLARRWEAS